MKVLGACSLGGAGHLQPLVPLLDAAGGRGCETRVIATPGLASLVGRSGHPFTAGGQPPEAEIAPIREALLVLPPHQASVLGNRDLFGSLATDAMLPAMRRLFDEWRPDLVLRDPCEYASFIVATDRGIPSVQVAIATAAVEWDSISVAAGALEARRPGMVEELRASPYVTRFPSSFDPTAFGDTRRFRHDGSRGADPLPDWWGASTAPLVYVTLGSVLGRMSVAEEAFRTVIAAVSALDTRVLVTTGSLDPAALGSLPANVHAERWVDQADVVATAQLVVCHGGSGTTLGTLEAGRPMVVVPQFGDQFANAAWVAASGAGLVVDVPAGPGGRRRPIQPVDGGRITEAVRRVLDEPLYRAAAATIGREMRAEPTADALIGELLRTAGGEVAGSP